MKNAKLDLARELLAQSLAAWRLPGSIERASDGALVVVGSRRSIRIDPRGQERKNPDRDLQLSGGTGVDDDAFVGRLGSLEELPGLLRRLM